MLGWKRRPVHTTPQLGGQGDGVPRLQLVNPSKVIIHPAIVASNIPIPDGGGLVAARALFQRSAVCALINFDAQADGGNLQRAQVAAALVEVTGDIGESCGAFNPGTATVNFRTGRFGAGNGVDQTADSPPGIRFWVRASPLLGR